VLRHWSVSSRGLQVSTERRAGALARRSNALGLPAARALDEAEGVV